MISGEAKIFGTGNYNTGPPKKTFVQFSYSSVKDIMQ